MDINFMDPPADLSELFCELNVGVVITYYYRVEHYEVRRSDVDLWWKIPLPPGDENVCSTPFARRCMTRTKI